MSLPQITAMFTTYGTPGEQLDQCITAVLADIPEAQIVIGYDACLDRMTEAARRWTTPNVLHLYVPDRQWCAAMVNHQIQLAKHEYVVWLADDCVVGNGQLVKALETHVSEFPDGCGVVGLNVGSAQAPFPLTTKTYLRNLYGALYLAWPEYVQCCWDSELSVRSHIVIAGGATHHIKTGVVETKGFTSDGEVYERRRLADWPSKRTDQ